MNLLTSSLVVLCAFLPSVVPAPAGSKGGAAPKPHSCAALYNKKCKEIAHEMSEQDFDQKIKYVPVVVQCIHDVKSHCKKDTDGVQSLNHLLQKIEHAVNKFVPAPAGSKGGAAPKPHSCAALYNKKCKEIAHEMSEQDFDQKIKYVPVVVQCIHDVKSHCKKDTDGVQSLNHLLQKIEHAVNKFVPDKAKPKALDTAKPGSCSVLYTKKCGPLANNLGQDLHKALRVIAHCINEVKKHCKKDTEGVEILNNMLASIEQEQAANRNVPAKSGHKAGATHKQLSCAELSNKKCEALANEIKEQEFHQQCKNIPDLVHCVQEVKKQCKKDTKGVEFLEEIIEMFELAADECNHASKAEKAKDVKKKKTTTVKKRTTTHRRRGW
ncbi:uncharacterized protein LOC131933260 [Physella acuta]|uniref:uncharacterized protein LOC131933260 n=1 Tax=Physella acuta TaxID=109671 RepID=UPI0027DE10C8|nr:uncharacterized protein LOC131933260 [Physella acuta]